MSTCTRLGALVLCVRLIVPHVGFAQSVRGIVVDSLSGRPLEEVATVLVDAHGATVATSWAREGGHFAIRAPGAGNYQLRVQRLGYRKTLTPVFSLGAGEFRDLRIAMPRVAGVLTGIRISERERCEAMPADGGGSVASVWEQARNAFQLVALTDGQNLVARVRDYSKEFAPIGDSIREQSSVERDGRSSNPYVSPSPDSIAKYGYVRRAGASLWYYAPDAGVLLSDAFLRDHCFRLQRSAVNDGTLIGVAFDPIRSRQVPDIKGVVWLDRATSELRSLDFNYTSLPRAAERAEFGGHVEFQRVIGGGWLIRAWRVRAPVIGLAEVRRVSGGGFGAQGITRTERVIDSVLTGIHEEGGEVLTARSTAGDLLWTGAFGSVDGRVVDSTTGSPLRDATAELRGSALRARSDADADEVRRCEDLRNTRENEIAAEMQVPINKWHPRGRDSLSIAAVLPQSAVVLQGVADTTGTVPPDFVRAIRRGGGAAYAAAVEAIGKLSVPVDEPLPGCKLRRVIVMPYRVHRDGPASE